MHHDIITDRAVITRYRRQPAPFDRLVENLGSAPRSYSTRQALLGTPPWRWWSLIHLFSTGPELVAAANRAWSSGYRALDDRDRAEIGAFVRRNLDDFSGQADDLPHAVAAVLTAFYGFVVALDEGRTPVDHHGRIAVDGYRDLITAVIRPILTDSHRALMDLKAKADAADRAAPLAPVASATVLKDVTLYGGGGGEPFDACGSSPIAGIRTWRDGSQLLDGIQLAWRDGDALQWGPIHGRETDWRDETILGRDEYIHGVAGRAGALIDALQLFTEWRTIDAVGGYGGEPFELFPEPRGRALTGIVGRAGDRIDALGFVFAD